MRQAIPVVARNGGSKEFCFLSEWRSESREGHESSSDCHICGLPESAHLKTGILFIHAFITYFRTFYIYEE